MQSESCADVPSIDSAGLACLSLNVVSLHELLNTQGICQTWRQQSSFILSRHLAEDPVDFSQEANIKSALHQSASIR